VNTLEVCVGYDGEQEVRAFNFGSVSEISWLLKKEAP
jgi:hypothetical protein